MEITKMTIHRALAELKLIDARINKSISDIVPSGLMQVEKKVNQHYDKKEFEETAKSGYQSITDLINRKHKIKSAITKANAVTTVNVGENEMTISEAINFKSIIEFKRNLISNLTSKHKNTLTLIEQNNAKVDVNALRLAESALGKDNVKIGEGDTESIMTPYKTANTFHLVDPLEVEKRTKTLQEEVDLFEAEIDAVLSEINAITTIEI